MGANLEPYKIKAGTRNTVLNTAGLDVTLQSVGATALATDKSAGTLALTPGLSTGTGISKTVLKKSTRASSTGTADNNLSEALIIPSEFNLTNSSANSIFEVALPTLTTCGGTINFTIKAGDGTDIQSYSGVVKYSAVNKGAVYTTSIVEIGTTFTCSVGTLEDVWSIVSGTDKITIKVTPTSSLTPTTYKLHYTISNESIQAITIL